MHPKDNILIETTATEAELPVLAKQIAEILVQKNPFCLWLQAEMGGGKTTFTKHLLHALGLPARVPVLSPTYTYVTEYAVGGVTYAHMDLYRLPGVDSLIEAGLNDQIDYRGIFVEWPPANSFPPALKPSHILTITNSRGGSTNRSYTLKECGV